MESSLIVPFRSLLILTLMPKLSHFSSDKVLGSSPWFSSVTVSIPVHDRSVLEGREGGEEGKIKRNREKKRENMCLEESLFSNCWRQSFTCAYLLKTVIVVFRVYRIFSLFLNIVESFLKLLVLVVKRSHYPCNLPVLLHIVWYKLIMSIEGGNWTWWIEPVIM